jgi:hypothetical protein
MTAALWAIAIGGVLALIVGSFGHRDRLASLPVDVEGFAARHELVLTPRVEVAVQRLLARHRSWRFHGGAAGALVASVVGVTRPGGFRIGVGVGGHFFPDLLVCVLAGVLGGVIAAESHHLRPSPSSGAGRTIASLEVREPSTFVDRASRVGRMVACVVALWLGVAWLVDRSSSPVVPWSVALLLLTTALVEWQQRRIVVRARPVLPTDLAAADTVFRGEAIVALHHAGNGLVCLLLANALAAAGDGSELFGVAALALSVVAVVNWRRSRIWVAPRGSLRFGAALP